MLQLPSFLLPFVGHTEAVIVATAVPETECNCGLYDAPSARSPPLPLLLWIRIRIRIGVGVGFGYGLGFGSGSGSGSGLGLGSDPNPVPGNPCHVPGAVDGQPGTSVDHGCPTEGTRS